MITYLQQLISNSPNGLITYADYISAVLYHPELGYYMREKPKIGRQEILLRPVIFQMYTEDF